MRPWENRQNAFYQTDKFLSNVWNNFRQLFLHNLSPALIFPYNNIIYHSEQNAGIPLSFVSGAHFLCPTGKKYKTRY